MTIKISYVVLTAEQARKFDLPQKFLTDVELPVHVKESAVFIAQGHNFEQLTPTKDQFSILPERACIDISVRTESVPRVEVFKLRK